MHDIIIKEYKRNILKSNWQKYSASVVTLSRRNIQEPKAHF